MKAKLKTVQVQADFLQHTLICTHMHTHTYKELIFCRHVNYRQFSHLHGTNNKCHVYIHILKILHMAGNTDLLS